MRKDKKQVGNNLTVVLIAENSDNSLDLIIKHDLDKQEVVDAFQYFLSLS